MLRVALSGGIASGKTTVSDAFEALGVPVVDADKLARIAMQPESSGLQQIVARFGDEILHDDCTLNRAALRAIVFDNKNARRDLERIIHPQIRKLTDAALEAHESADAAYVVVVIPLLVETKQTDRYDRIVIVDVRRETQISRLLERDGGSKQNAENILASQATREQRLDVADYVISNEGSVEEVREQVDQLHRTLLDLAQSSFSSDL